MSALSLIIGIIVGAAVASAAWFVAVAAKRKKLDEQRRAKEEVMTSIGELLADADAYEASYRCGTLTADRFSRGLIDRVNAISRPLRTNMHILDVFFVKYAEQQVDEYMRMIENPERRAEALKAIRAAADGREEADNETRLGIAPVAVAGERETDAISVEERDVFDADVESREETFVPLPVGAVDVDEDAFELPEASAPPPEPEPQPEPAESVFDDIAAEEEEAALREERFFEEIAEPEIPEEEQVFGGSPEPPVPEKEQVFGESPEPSAPEQEEAADDSWAEKSLEEFEAEFARFEEQAATVEEPETPEESEAEAAPAEQSIEVGRETGGFFMSEPELEPEPQPEPKPEPESESKEREEDIFDIQTPPPDERTETQQFDKPSEEEPAEHDGITGDDVSDAIDSFFKIK
jgi:hypothetical protein